MLRRGSGGVNPYVLTIRAEAGQLDCVVIEGETHALTEASGGCGDPRVLGFHHGPALAADQELHGVRVVGMLAGDEGARGFQSVDQAVFEQEIEAAIDAGGGERGVGVVKDVADFVG